MKTKFPCTKRRRHTRSLAFSGDSPKNFGHCFESEEYVKLRILQRLVKIQFKQYPNKRKIYLARRFPKLFFKLSKPPRSLQKDSFNIYVLQSLLALSEGDSPDRSLLIRRHTQHKRHVQNTLNHVHFMNLF